MKKFYFSVYLVLAALLLQAQVPAGFSYQAVIRNDAGELMKNRNIGIRFTLLKGSEVGAPVYSEVIYPTTNANGLVTAEIGKTNPSQFSQVNWSDGIYYLKTETDVNGGMNYTITGVSRLLSVPFAMYAAQSGTQFSGNYNDLTNKPTFSTVATTGNYADLFGRPAFATVATTGNYSDLLGRPAFATVATTGNYSDLLGKPSLATVATTGRFTDLLNVPILVTLQKDPMAGDVVYHNGTQWELLARGANGQTLRLDNGMPKWAEPGYALPLVTTLPVSDLMVTEATSGGNIVNTGFTEVTARGICWSTNQNPTTADSKTSEGAGTGGSFTSKATGLLANTTYYMRAYATNGAGTAYGNQVSFKTYQSIVFPTITTTVASNIGANTAASGGNITQTGGAPVTARGICWSTNQNPTITDGKTTEGSGTGQFASQAINLLPGTTYYIRAYATNSSGTGYGNQVTVITTKTVPVITTKAISDISAMGGVSGGTITATGGSNITEKGICWGESPNPTVSDNVINSGTGQQAFTSAIIKAIPNTTYYVRAYAKNETGIGYGDEKSFKTSEAQYFQSFETGTIPVGWSGTWTSNSSNAYVGSYSFISLAGVSSDAICSVTLASPGQINFYYYLNCGQYGCSQSRTSMDFYIDNEKMINYPASSGWNQGSFKISSGTHVLKWHFNASYGGNGFIDYIVITK
jgi:hypothetical protein